MTAEQGNAFSPNIDIRESGDIMYDTVEIAEPDLAARKHFSKLGFALFLYIAVAYILQIGINLAVNMLWPHIAEQSWYIWALALAPMYAVALPLFIAYSSKIPAKAPEKRNISLVSLMGFFLISEFLMYAGNYIGNILLSAVKLFTGNMPVNGVDAIINGSDSLMVFIAAVVAAPIAEELVFRKILIDRVINYGEGTAMLLSAAVFGLMHGNFYQLFYAFGIGMVFAYVYIKSGKIIYTIILHAVMNFIGSIVAPAAAKHADTDALFNSKNSIDTLKLITENMGDYIPLIIYLCMTLSMAVAGFVLLLSYRKQITLNIGEIILPKNKKTGIICLNAGMILFGAACLSLLVVSVAG